MNSLEMSTMEVARASLHSIAKSLGRIATVLENDRKFIRLHGGDLVRRGDVEGIMQDEVDGRPSIKLSLGGYFYHTDFSTVEEALKALQGE